MQDVGKKIKKILRVCILQTHERRIYSHAQPLPPPALCFVYSWSEMSQVCGCVSAVPAGAERGVKLTDPPTHPPGSIGSTVTTTNQA